MNLTMDALSILHHCTRILGNHISSAKISTSTTSKPSSVLFYPHTYQHDLLRRRSYCYTITGHRSTINHQGLEMYDSQPIYTMVLRCLTLNHYNHLENEDNSPISALLLTRSSSGRTPGLDKTDPFQQ